MWKNKTKKFCKGVVGFFFILFFPLSPFQLEASAHLLASRVMSHPSAAKRLGYMLPWKCTSCVIIRYSGPNRAHPLSYLVNMSHLICAASRPCATPAEGAGQRASVECGTQYCMWTWTLACIYLKVCPLGTPGTRLRSRGGTDANASWFWEMKEGHVTRRDDTRRGWRRGNKRKWNVEVSLHEPVVHTCTHLQPRHCQGWRVGSSILFYFLTVYLGSAHWAQSQTDTPEVQRHLQKYFTGATRQVWISGFLSCCQSGWKLCLNILTFIGSCTANILIFSFHFEGFFPLRRQIFSFI